jgi:hypothetical protein
MPGQNAVTTTDTVTQIARGGPDGGGGDAEAKTSSGGIEVSHDDAPNRDMTHQAPSSPVRSTDMVFTRSKNLHARASGGRHRHPRRSRHPGLHKGSASRGATRTHRPPEGRPKGWKRHHDGEAGGRQLPRQNNNASREGNDARKCCCCWPSTELDIAFARSSWERDEAARHKRQPAALGHHSAEREPPPRGGPRW